MTSFSILLDDNVLGDNIQLLHCTTLAPPRSQQQFGPSSTSEAGFLLLLYGYPRPFWFLCLPKLERAELVLSEPELEYCFSAT
jgi:hypothetical protein